MLGNGVLAETCGIADVFNLISIDRREAARAAVKTTFGSAQPTEIVRIAGGASQAEIYRIEISGRPYLLRLEGTDRVGFHDPHRSFRCMRIAAEVGVAPPLHYADPETGAAVMDFVPTRSIFEYPGERLDLLRDLSGLFARLRDAADFPRLAEYPAIVAHMLGLVRASKLFAPGLLDQHSDALTRIRDAYRWDAYSLVASHNDPNPGNILFDGQRLWLVDWETAFLNDPLVDAATAANFLVTTGEQENLLLDRCLGRAPQAGDRARFTLMRQMSRLLYAGFMLGIAAARPLAKVEEDLAAPSLPQVFSSIAQGSLAGGAPDTMLVFGKAFLKEFLDCTRTAAHEDALNIARQN
jgi:aminoglycoside phosphotransferase (APT) family kinase protein